MLQLRPVQSFSAIILLMAFAACTPIPTATAPKPTLAPTRTTAPPPAVSSPTVPPATFTPQPSAVPPGTPASSEIKGDPASGAKLFASLPCSSCHDVTHPFPGGEVCPNLGNIATEAERIIQGPAYQGKAKTPAEYIRESIMNPNAYIVPGENYSTPDGQSVMPKNFSTLLTAAQIDDLVAYLMTLK